VGQNSIQFYSNTEKQTQVIGDWVTLILLRKVRFCWDNSSSSSSSSGGGSSSSSSSRRRRRRRRRRCCCL